MEVNSSVVLPVSAAQMTAFSNWIIQTYGTYDAYIGALKDPAMDLYIKENMLPVEMQTVMRRSERFRGEKYGDVTIQTLLLYRRRITAKMKNLKEKVGKLTFPNEAALTRTANREAAASRSQARSLALVRENQLQAAYDAAYDAAYAAADAAFAATFNAPYPTYMQYQPLVRIVKVHLLAEDSCMDGDGDCAICMIKHVKTDSCVINNCGHQFGSSCLNKWTGRGGGGRATCPLCRAVVTEITEFTKVE